MFKQIALDKAQALYNKGITIYLKDKDSDTALPWDHVEDSIEFKDSIGYYSDDVRAFIACNVSNSSKI